MWTLVSVSESGATQTKVDMPMCTCTQTYTTMNCISVWQTHPKVTSNESHPLCNPFLLNVNGTWDLLLANQIGWIVMELSLQGLYYIIRERFSSQFQRSRPPCLRCLWGSEDRELWWPLWSGCCLWTSKRTQLSYVEALDPWIFWDNKCVVLSR